MADIIFDNPTHDPRRQTFIIPLTYSDIALGAADIPRISHGGDIWEMRVDLLSPSREPLGITNLPPLSYVQAQIKLLQSLSDMPILFTIRTAPQGGKFPADAEKEALALMLMAVEERCKYIDIEIEWSPEIINAVFEKKGSSNIIASFHDWTGDIRWTSDLLREKYTTADAFGGKHTQIVSSIQSLASNPDSIDIIKLSILSADVYDCHGACSVRKKSFFKNPKPLLAVGMGQYGQLPRMLSPISLVTHELLPAPSAPGQLTLAEVNRGTQLMGLLPRQ